MSITIGNWLDRKKHTRMESGGKRKRVAMGLMCIYNVNRLYFDFTLKSDLNYICKNGNRIGKFHSKL